MIAPSPVGRAAALAALAALSLLAACGGTEAEAGATAAEAVVLNPENLVLVAESTLADGPPVAGALTAEREARVRAELGGSLLEVTVDVGDEVREGQVLARIEPTTAREAALSARAQLRSAESSLELVRRNAARARRLQEAGAIAARDVEDDEQAVAAGEAAVADAQSRLAAAERTLARASVRAPFAGVVATRPASPGDVVQPGTELLSIVDPGSLRFEAQVPAEALGGVRVGTPVAFGVNGFEGQAFRGRVRRVSPVVDPATRQVQLLIAIPNPGRRLVAGLYAEGRATTTERRVASVPLAALDVRSTAPAVLRLRGGTVERVPVTLGLRDLVLERVEVGGVAVGDTVLLPSAQGIVPGSTVRVTKE